MTSYLFVREAHAVRDEGTVVVYEGIYAPDEDDPDTWGTVWFALDHGVARTLPEVLDALVEPWQILASTAVTSRDPETGRDRRPDPDGFVGPDERPDESHPWDPWD